MLFARKKSEMPTPETALKGRAEPIPTAKTHFVNKRALKGPYPEGLETAIFGLGCFWGAERKFWEMGDGIWVTAVGYAGGPTPNPTYEEVCSGRTGHNEVVLVVFDPKKVELRGAAEDVLGEPRPDAGHAPGQRRRHPVSLRHLCDFAGAARRPPRRPRPPTRRCCRPTAMGRSPPRSSTRRRSTSPRTITSSTWPRCRTAIAVSAARA